jgi:hypothetical protein
LSPDDSSAVVELFIEDAFWKLADDSLAMKRSENCLFFCFARCDETLTIEDFTLSTTDMSKWLSEVEKDVNETVNPSDRQKLESLVTRLKVCSVF